MDGRAIVMVELMIEFAGEDRHVAAQRATRTIGTDRTLLPLLASALLKAMANSGRVEGWPGKWQIDAVDVEAVTRE